LIDLNGVQPVGARPALSCSPGEVAALLVAQIEELATALVGEPNRTLSTPDQLRFGT
jgi:hypothetical protein